MSDDDTVVQVKASVAGRVVPMRVLVTDATSSGDEIARLLLADVPNPLLLRDLIRHRVREEVARFNSRPGRYFNGLVQPTDSEVTLNGYDLKRPRRLDCESQADAALIAFTQNRYFVFVGNRQVDDLDELLTLAETDVVSFVRLVPLVGG